MGCHSTKNCILVLRMGLQCVISKVVQALRLCHSLACTMQMTVLWTWRNSQKWRCKRMKTLCWTAANQ